MFSRTQPRAAATSFGAIRVLCLGHEAVGHQTTNATVAGEVVCCDHQRLRTLGTRESSASTDVQRMCGGDIIIAY